MIDIINNQVTTIEDEAKAIIDKAHAVVDEIGGPQRLMEYFYPELRQGYRYSHHSQSAIKPYERGYNPMTGRILSLDKTFNLISIGQRNNSQPAIDAGMQLINDYNSTCIEVVSGALQSGLISRDVLHKSSGDFLESWKNHDGTIEAQINNSFENKFIATMEQYGFNATPTEQAQ